MIALLIMAIVYEAIKIGRERLKLMEFSLRKSETIEMNGFSRGTKSPTGGETKVVSPG